MPAKFRTALFAAAAAVIICAAVVSRSSNASPRIHPTNPKSTPCSTCRPPHGIAAILTPS